MRPQKRTGGDDVIELAYKWYVLRERERERERERKRKREEEKERERETERDRAKEVYRKYVNLI